MMYLRDEMKFGLAVLEITEGNDGDEARDVKGGRSQ